MARNYRVSTGPHPRLTDTVGCVFLAGVGCAFAAALWIAMGDYADRHPTTTTAAQSANNSAVKAARGEQNNGDVIARMVTMAVLDGLIAEPPATKTSKPTADIDIPF